MATASISTTSSAVEYNPIVAHHNFFPTCKKYLNNVVEKVKDIFKYVIQLFVSITHWLAGGTPKPGAVTPAPTPLPKELIYQTGLDMLVSPQSAIEDEPLLGRIPKEYNVMVQAISRQQPLASPTKVAILAHQKLSPEPVELTRFEQMMAKAAVIYDFTLPTIFAGLIASRFSSSTNEANRLQAYKRLYMQGKCVREISALVAASYAVRPFSPFLGSTLYVASVASGLWGLYSNQTLMDRVWEFYEGCTAAKPEQLEMAKAKIQCPPNHVYLDLLYNKVLAGTASLYDLKTLLQAVSTENPVLREGLALRDEKNKVWAVHFIGSMATGASGYIAAGLLTNNPVVRLSTAGAFGAARWLMPNQVMDIERKIVDCSQQVLSKVDIAVDLQNIMVYSTTARTVQWVSSFVFEHSTSNLFSGATMVLGSVLYEPFKNVSNQLKKIDAEDLRLEQQKQEADPYTLPEIIKEQSQTTAKKVYVVAQGAISATVRFVAYYGVSAIVENTTGSKIGSEIAGAAAACVVDSVAEKAWGGICKTASAASGWFSSVKARAMSWAQSSSGNCTIEKID